MFVFYIISPEKKESKCGHMEFIISKKKNSIILTRRSKV